MHGSEHVARQFYRCYCSKALLCKDLSILVTGTRAVPEQEQ